jgi:dipeptidyl aminopeptidase/acylaminoacyl peptidase
MLNELDRISPAMQASRITAPVLLIHGGKDERAPKEHAFLMRAALEKAERPPEWYYVDYEGHGFYDTANQTAVYQKMDAFFGKYLGAGASTAAPGAVAATHSAR